MHSPRGILRLLVMTLRRKDRGRLVIGVSLLHVRLRVRWRGHRPDWRRRIGCRCLICAGNMGRGMRMLAVRLLVLRRIFHDGIGVVTAVPVTSINTPRTMNGRIEGFVRRSATKAKCDPPGHNAKMQDSLCREYPDGLNWGGRDGRRCSLGYGAFHHRRTSAGS